MKTRSYSWLYALLWPLVYFAARLFYRRWKVLGLQNFPKKHTPAILVANHQNALIDPLLCCLSAPRQLHFLTRADVFRNPLLRPLVLALNMLPVYRVRDKESGKSLRNMKTFDTAIARMQKGAVVGVFPEGNHGDKKILRPLKKGLAQLLDISAEKAADLRELQILPVGVDYSHYDHARSSVVVNYGKPFVVSDLLFSEEERMDRYRAVMSRVQEKLDEVMLNLGPSSHYPYLSLAEKYLIEKHGYNEWQKVQGNLHTLRNKLKRDASAEESIDKARSLSETLESEGLTFAQLAAFASGRRPKPFKTVLLGLIALPGFALHAPAWQLTLAATRKVVSDPQFNSTFRLLFGLLLFSLTWVLVISQSFVFLAPREALVLISTLLVSSLLALPFSDRLIDGDSYRKVQKVFIRHADLEEDWKDLTEDIENRLSHTS